MIFVLLALNDRLEQDPELLENAEQATANNSRTPLPRTPKGTEKQFELAET